MEDGEVVNERARVNGAVEERAGRARRTWAQVEEVGVNAEVARARRGTRSARGRRVRDCSLKNVNGSDVESRRLIRAGL